MHNRLCNLPERVDQRHGLEALVSPVATGDTDHTGDTNLPVFSTRSPVSPVSPVARTREGFRSTTRFGESGRVLYARVNFSEPCGGAGDTGDTITGWTSEAINLRRPNVVGGGGLGSQRLVPASRRSMRNGAPVPSGIRGATSASSELRALAGRVRRLGLTGRFDPEAAFIERDELARALHRLADGLERRAGQQPAAAPAPTPRAALPRRFAAVLATKAIEIASLRALLAQRCDRDAADAARHPRPSSCSPSWRLPMTAEEFLEHAAALVTRRRHQYGAPPRPVRARGCALVSSPGDEGDAGTGHGVPGRSEGRQADARSTTLRQHHRYRGLRGLLGGGAVRCVS
jgi:hypothetical protein